MESVLERIVVHPDGTIVLHFVRNSLFGPLVSYEIQPPKPMSKPANDAQRDRPDLVVGETHLQANARSKRERPQDTRASANQASAIMSLCSPDAGDFSRRMIDFGRGIVVAYEYPGRNTASVPSGI